MKFSHLISGAVLSLLVLLSPAAAAQPMTPSASNVSTQINNLLQNPVTVKIWGGVASWVKTHIQGVAALSDGNWVLSHDHASRNYGSLIFISPLERKTLGVHEFTVGGTNPYPAGMQACGNIVAVSTGGEKKVRFFNCANWQSPTELTHLALDTNGTSENVALVWQPKFSRYYLLVRSDKLYVSSSADLTNANTRWNAVTMSANIEYGEAGTALIHESGTNDLYAFSLGRGANTSSGENDFKVWKLKMGTSNNSQVTVSDVGSYQLKDGSGSFRWGGTVTVTGSGHLQIIAAPRDLYKGGYQSFGTWTSTSAGTVTAKKYRLHNHSVFCRETGEGGEDEIFLIFGNGKRFPSSGYHSINEDEGAKSTWHPNASVDFVEGSSMSVALREVDDSSGDDIFGKLTVPTKKGSGVFKATQDGGDYDIKWSVTEVN